MKQKIFLIFLWLVFLFNFSFAQKKIDIPSLKGRITMKGKITNKYIKLKVKAIGGVDSFKIVKQFFYQTATVNGKHSLIRKVESDTFFLSSDTTFTYYIPFVFGDEDEILPESGARIWGNIYIWRTNGQMQQKVYPRGSFTNGSFKFWFK